MLLHLALHKDGRSRRIEAGGQKVQRHFERVGRDGRGVGVVGGECVQVGDEKVAVVLVVLILQLDPVGKGAHVVAEMELAGGAHAAEHAGTER